MSNNNATDTAEVFDILDTGDNNYSRGCNAHIVNNNTACKVRLSVLTAEWLTTTTPTLAKVLQALR
nr:MAG TPA: hypothetical protein [Caudoviricetes sp.]